MPLYFVKGLHRSAEMLFDHYEKANPFFKGVKRNKWHVTQCSVYNCLKDAPTQSN